MYSRINSFEDHTDSLSYCGFDFALNGPCATIREHVEHSASTTPLRLPIQSAQARSHIGIHHWNFRCDECLSREISFRHTMSSMNAVSKTHRRTFMRNPAVRIGYCRTPRFFTPFSSPVEQVTVFCNCIYDREDAVQNHQWTAMQNTLCGPCRSLSFSALR
jgi:hypothetical protein